MPQRCHSLPNSFRRSDPCLCCYRNWGNRSVRVAGFGRAPLSLKIASQDRMIGDMYLCFSLPITNILKNESLFLPRALRDAFVRSADTSIRFSHLNYPYVNVELCSPCLARRKYPFALDSSRYVVSSHPDPMIRSRLC